jgi:hypothetical protein
MVSWKISAAVLLCAAACGKGTASTPEAQAQTHGTGELGVSALPAETRVIIGASVPRIAASPLARRLVGEILGRDPEAAQRLGQLLGRCHIELEHDVNSITIAMAEGQDVALLARGSVDGKALADCVRAEATAGGGSFAEKNLAGHAVYTATSASGTQKVWLAFGADRTVVAALSEPWLAKILDPAGAKIEGRPDTLALIKRVPAEAAIWGVGYVPATVGGQLVKLTQGQVAQPATAVAFDASFDHGLTGTLRMDLKSTDDADHLATFAQSQLDWLTVAAQEFKLGQLVAKARITTDGPSVKLAVKLDDADVRKLEAALGDNPQPKKEPSR